MNIYVLTFIFVLIVLFFGSQFTENFQGIFSSNPFIKIDPNEFSKDIRYFASYVGVYIAGIYEDRRSRQFNDSTGVGVGNWAPKGTLDNVDPILLQNDDNLLSNSRFQLKAYLNSVAKFLLNKYSIDEIDRNVGWNLYYTENPGNGVLKITYIENGNQTSYLV